jgi:hypothetical protein
VCQVNFNHMILLGKSPAEIEDRGQEKHGCRDDDQGLDLYQWKLGLALVKLFSNS